MLSKTIEKHYLFTKNNDDTVCLKSPEKQNKQENLRASVIVDFQEL